MFHRPKEFGYLYDRYAGWTTFIPHHVDCAIFKPTTSLERKHDSKVYTIGYVGRLVRAKGVHVLIEACSRLPSNVRLLIVGEGEEDVHLRNLAAIRGISDRVEFQSPIRYAEMPDLLNRFDTLVLPSLKTSTWTELFGRVLIEAMACGIPVVASDSGGIPEVVGESGLLFETGNVSSLTGRLSELLTNLQLRNELGASGRLRGQKLFDVPVVMKQLKNVIEQML